MLSQYGWKKYLDSYHTDIYSFSELGAIRDHDGTTLDLAEILQSEAPHYELAENDFFFYGGRLKEGATQQDLLNFGWTGYIIRRTEGEVFVIIGVVD